MTDLPHFSFPFRFAQPQAATTEQDSIDEIADCVLAILLCPLGYRSELPSFGNPDPTFSTPRVDVEEMRSVIELWEPRAATAFDEQPDLLDELITHVETQTRVRSEE